MQATCKQDSMPESKADAVLLLEALQALSLADSSQAQPIVVTSGTIAKCSSLPSGNSRAIHRVTSGSMLPFG
jgi:hypothetical protein